jgi:TonB family protein
MSAAPSLALEKTQRRAYPRRPVHVPLDVIALRSGVPENLPGRCTDLSESGVGAVIAGELVPNQQVAVELRLPNVGVPVRARARVRYQSRLCCGLEFTGLSAEQRAMIRYWVDRCASAPVDCRDLRKEGPVATAGMAMETEAPVAAAQPAAKPRRRIRVGRRGFYLLFACTLALAGLGWWQWQRSWSELETRELATQAAVAEQGLQASPETVSAETMAKRIVTKVEPAYPEAARSAGTEGLVVLDAVIRPDGSVKSLRPVSGPDLLVHAATEAVQSWKFEPYLTSGHAVEVETTIAVEFRLQ